MLKIMKNFIQRYITKIEEKYVFNISLFFWHFIIALVAIAVIISLFFVVKGILPVKKEKVLKPEYPTEIVISAEEIKELVQKEKARIAPKKQKTSEQVTITEQKDYEEVERQKSPDEIKNQQLIDSLKVLLPPSRYLWIGGYQSYYYGRGYDYQYGIFDFIETAFNNINANSLSEQNAILYAMIKTISKFQENNRYQVFRTLIHLCTDNLDNALKNISLIDGSIKHFGTEKLDYISILASFRLRNPNEGADFIEMVNNTMQHFNKEFRLKVLEEMRASFANYFNNRISLQIKLTEEFAGIAPSIEPEFQAFALTNYYVQYLVKNQDRENQIQEIDMMYENDLANAETEYLIKKNKRKEILKKGAIGLGGGIVMISLIAILLVMLSMQRYLKKIEEKMSEQKFEK